MLSDNIAIQVSALSKVYPLYNSSNDGLKEALHPLRGKYRHILQTLGNISFEIKNSDVQQ